MKQKNKPMYRLLFKSSSFSFPTALRMLTGMECKSNMEVVRNIQFRSGQECVLCEFGEGDEKQEWWIPLPYLEVIEKIESENDLALDALDEYSFLIGKMVSYRYVDWQDGSFTPYFLCTNKDLHKFIDKSIDVIQFKP